MVRFITVELDSVPQLIIAVVGSIQVALTVLIKLLVVRALWAITTITERIVGSLRFSSIVRRGYFDGLAVALRFVAVAEQGLAGFGFVKRNLGPVVKCFLQPLVVIQAVIACSRQHSPSILASASICCSTIDASSTITTD